MRSARADARYAPEHDLPRSACGGLNGHVTEEPSPWVTFVPDERNEHLSPEERQQAEATLRAEAAQRGKHLGRVVVDVYERGEVPQTQGAVDPAEAAELVRRARVALEGWR